MCEIDFYCLRLFNNVAHALKTLQVRANVVRALGNLARFVDFSAESSGWSDFMGMGHKNIVYPRGSQASASQWLGTMVQTFVSCVTTGNVKVSVTVYCSLFLL